MKLNLRIQTVSLIVLYVLRTEYNAYGDPDYEPQDPKR